MRNFDMNEGPARPFTAKPGLGAAVAVTQGHIQGVNASSSGLVRATLGSAAAAGAILVLFWLPAEYGIDLTGLGRVMGLTGMGEIKQQLYAEADAEDAAALAAANGAAPVVGASGAVAASADPQVMQRLDAIEAQLAGIAATVGAAGVPAAAPVAAPVAAPAAEQPAEPVAEPVTAPLPRPEVIAAAPVEAPAAAAPEWRDSWSYTLQPGEGIEAKLVMQEGAEAQFNWTANGGVLNHDTHGDGGGQNISYEKGRNVADQTGTLTAAFTGNHGWYWRNRTDAPITFTLNVNGDYERLLTP